MEEAEEGRRRLWKDGGGRRRTEKAAEFRKRREKARECWSGEEGRDRRWVGALLFLDMGDGLFRGLANAKRKKIDGEGQRKLEEAGE